MRWKFWINSAVFVLIITAIALANLVWMETASVSEKENRPLAPFPRVAVETLRSGEFSKQFSNYIDDRFPARDTITDISYRLEQLRGVSARNNAELVTIREGDRFAAALPVRDFHTGKIEKTEAPAAEEVQPPAEKRQPEEEAEAAVAEEQTAGEKIVNQVLLLEKRGMEILDCKKEFGAYYAEAVLGFLSHLPEDIPAYAILVPSHIAFLDTRGFEQFGLEQQEGISSFYSLLGDSVTLVDAFGALEPEKNEYIYFRTDHHWTALGAYYVYRQFMETAGLDAVPLSRYESKFVENFVGSMYLYTLDKRLADNPDTIEYYVPFVEHEYHTYWDDVEKKKPVIDLSYETDQNKYQIFISSDQQLGIIKNNVESDRTILVFKDSYGNAFIPLLMPHYREIHVIDPRYYNHNVVQYYREHDIDDVLFINYFGVVASAGGYAYNLKRVTGLPFENRTEQEPREPRPEE